MLGADETRELRDLQARAYGRGGALTDGEAVRLRELERARAGAPGGRAVAVDGVPRVVEVADGVADLEALISLPSGGLAGDVHGDRDNPFLTASVAPDAAKASEPGADSRTVLHSPDEASVFVRLRQHWRIAALFVLAAMMLGLAAGWALFHDRGPEAIPLDAEQQGWQNAILIEARYDSGSLVPIAEEDGVILWFATRDGGALYCVILGNGEKTAPACVQRKVAEVQGLSVNLQRQVDGESGEVNAQVQFDSQGDPAAITSSYLTSNQAMQYATEEEARIADLLVDAGFDQRMLWVVGYDGKTPIWSAVEAATQRPCLIYDGSTPDPETVCDDDGDLWAAGGSLVLDHADAESGTSTRITYMFGNGPSYLEIERGHDASGE